MKIAFLLAFIASTVIALLYIYFREKQIQAENQSGYTHGDYVYVYLDDSVYNSCFDIYPSASILDFIKFDIAERDYRLDGIHLRYFATSKDGKFLVQLAGQDCWVKPGNLKKSNRYNDSDNSNVLED